MLGLVETIKTFITQEFAKIESEFRSFKTGVCKSLESIERKFVPRLALIEQKINILERGQRDHLDIQVAGIEKKESRLEKAFKLLKDDFKYMGDEERLWKI